VGESDRRGIDDPRYFALDGFVQDVAAVGRPPALRDVVVVGHSAGTLVAMLAAIAAPERLAKTVLLAASPRYLNAPGYYGGFERLPLSNS
jgi:sigma-B regulation protein RsbQ